MRKGKENEKDKKKEKEKRSHGRHKYGQAKYKHAKKGILSCWIAFFALLLLCALLAAAYISAGTAAPYIGGVGFIALLLACNGCASGVRGFKERDKNYITCKIGVGLNLFLIGGFISIFCRGLF